MNRNLKRLLKNLVYPVLYLFLGLSYLMPRNKNVWVFGSFSGAFDDNVKYLFIYVNEHCPKIRPIWVSKNRDTVNFMRNKNFKAYHKYSIQGLWYALRGGFYLVNGSALDINAWVSGGSVIITLWHGVPIKKIAFDDEINKDRIFLFESKIKNIFFYPTFYMIKSNFILSTSKKVSALFSSAFLVKKEKCLNFGYPRNEILSYSKNNIMNFIEKYESIETKKLVQNLKDYDKVFVYMPTWRDDGRDFIQSAGFDFETLNKILYEKNYYLILKLHHLTRLSVNIEQYENILLIDNKLDVYPILPFTDCLITDYSSIFFDYKLMNKEVILFPFDKEEYISKDREMYYDYSLVTENQLVANSFSELLKFIQSDVKSTKNNKLLQEMIFETREIDSCKEIVEFIQLTCRA